MLRPLPVVLQRLGSRRLLPAAHQRQTPDLQQFRCRKEHHVHGIAIYRIAQAALIDHQRLHPSPFRLHRTSQPGRPCTHTNHVVCRHIRSISPFFTRLRKFEAWQPVCCRQVGYHFCDRSNAPRQRLEGAPSCPPFCRMDSYDQSRNALLLLRLSRRKRSSFRCLSRIDVITLYNFRLSKAAANSVRNFSNSLNLSSVAATCFCFQTNTSPSPRLNFTLKFPSTIRVAGANNRNPPFSTGASTAAYSPRCTHKAFSYGAIAIGRNPASNNRSSVSICNCVSSTIRPNYTRHPRAFRDLGRAFDCLPEPIDRHFLKKTKTAPPSSRRPIPSLNSVLRCSLYPGGYSTPPLSPPRSSPP